MYLPLLLLWSWHACIDSQFPAWSDLGESVCHFSHLHLSTLQLPPREIRTSEKKNLSCSIRHDHEWNSGIYQRLIESWGAIPAACWYLICLCGFSDISQPLLTTDVFQMVFPYGTPPIVLQKTDSGATGGATCSSAPFPVRPRQRFGRMRFLRSSLPRRTTQEKMEY